MSARLEARLVELKVELHAGTEQLRELVQREAALRETLLRISGAIQVLEELRRPAHDGNGDGDGHMPTPEPADRSGPDVLTVG